VDVPKLDVLYHDLPPYQPEHASDFAAAKETRATLPSMEPIAFPSELAGEMMVVFPMPPVLVTTGLRESLA